MDSSLQGHFMNLILSIAYLFQISFKASCLRMDSPPPPHQPCEKGEKWHTSKTMSLRRTGRQSASNRSYYCLFIDKEVPTDRVYWILWVPNLMMSSLLLFVFYFEALSKGKSALHRTPVGYLNGALIFDFCWMFYMSDVVNFSRQTI